MFGGSVFDDIQPMGSRKVLCVPLLFIFALGAIFLLVAGHLSNLHSTRSQDFVLHVSDIQILQSQMEKNPELEIVPRIIHQTSPDRSRLPAKLIDSQNKCIEMHPSFHHMHWTDDDLRSFIATNYSWFLPTFDSYPYNIQRVDSSRYFILYHFGGIYLDMDIACARPLDPLLTLPAVFPLTVPVGLSNDFMVSTKHHPFMLQLMNSLTDNARSYGFNYATVMLSAGPLFVSWQWFKYLLYEPAHQDVQIKRLPCQTSNPADGQGKCDESIHFDSAGGATRPLVYTMAEDVYKGPSGFASFVGGNSWHSWDAQFILWMGNNLVWTLLIVASSCLLGSCILGVALRCVFCRKANVKRS